MPFVEWTTVGQRLARVASVSSWWLGDWLLFGQRSYGQRYREAVDATDLDYQTLRNYASVARRFPPSRRHSNLSFQHHAEVAPMSEAEQDLWLARAQAGGWSRNALRRQLALHRASTRRPGPAATNVVVRVEVTREDELRWRQAAACDELELREWLHRVVDAAAEAALRGDGSLPFADARADRGERTPVAFAGRAARSFDARVPPAVQAAV
jgi:hypothetical protein